MFWFNDSIRSAVDKVKSSGAFLLVFVQGNDSLSEKYETYLNEKAVNNLEDCLAIKIPYDSVALKQFKQIYVSVPVPSIFIIQNNGIPLKILSSSNISVINSEINDALNKQKLMQEKKQNVQSKNKSIPNSSTKSDGETSAELSHVKNIGRKVFDISEDELKARLREIRAFPKFVVIDSSKPSDPPRLSETPSIKHSARIQFRLPNNGTPSWEFPNLSTLRDVKMYLMEKMNLSPNFKLIRTYPRYEFTPADENRTLVELSLTPSAILVVMPNEEITVPTKVTDLFVNHDFLSTVLNMLLKPFFSLVGFFRKYFWRTPEVEKTPQKHSRAKNSDKTMKKKKSSTGSNIHGFKFDEGTDTDTEHPDNGNSTQQKFQ